MDAGRGVPLQLADPPDSRIEKGRAYARQLRAELSGLRPRQSLSGELAAHARAVFLSPHRDDVCFSLGATALRLNSGTLINLFTRSQYVADAAEREERNADAVTRLREEEDRRFAEHCGLRRIDLGLEEPPLRGRKPFEPAGIDEDRAILTGPLLECLIALAPEVVANERAMLFCPAAIGGHANHIATLLTVAEAMPTLERRFRILFYEDLHYASSGSKRRAGLMRLFAIMKGRQPVRHRLPLGAQATAKLGAIRLYRSQFSALPGDLRRFTPSTWVPMAPHEAVWEFST